LNTFPRTLSLLAGLALACTGNGNVNPIDDDDTGPTYEPGCIAVSGDTFTYAHIADALSEAAAGATITLCEDLVQAIVINKQVTIDADSFKLRPPVNTSAVTVVAGGDATVINAVVETTRSAFVVEGGNLTVRDTELAAVPNYGVDVQTGASATLERVTMNSPQWGGARVSGGTLVLRDSVIVAPGDYGVYIERDGRATLENNRIEGPTLRDTSQNNLFDIGGTGVWLESGATANLKNNQIIGPEVIGISADDSRELTLDGDVILGGFAGVTVRNTVFSATDTRVESYFGYGVLCVTCRDVALKSVTVETDPDLSRVGAPGVDGSIGLFGIETNFIVTGTTEAPSRFAGNNYAGVLVSPRQGGSRADIDISDAQIDNNAAFGLAVYSGEANLERVAVTNTRNDDPTCNTSSGRACNMAVAYWSANGKIVDSTISDSADWGLTIVQGVVEVEGSTFARNEFVGAFAQQATLIVEDSDFVEGLAYGVYLTSGATGTFDRVRFRDSKYVSDFEYSGGEGIVIRQVNHYQALDMVVFGSDLTLTNSSFENGERGIQASGSGSAANVTVVDTTWKNYHYDLLYGFSGSVITATRVRFDEIGRYAVRCSSGDVRLERATFSEFTASPYRFEYYQNGVLQFDSVSTQPGEPLWSSGCSMRLDDVTIENSDSAAAYLNNSTLLANGLTVRNVARTRSSGGALQIQYSSPTTPSAFLNNVSVKGVAFGDGVRASGWIDSATSRPAEGTISFTNLAIGGPDEADRVAGDGLEAINVGDLAISGLDVDRAGDQGLRLTRTTAEIAGVTSRRTGTIRNVTGAGVRIDGTGTPESVSLSQLTIVAPGQEGVWTNFGSHELRGVTVSGAGTFGATCVPAGDLAVCEDSVFDGASGSLSGCTCSGG